MVTLQFYRELGEVCPERHAFLAVTERH